MRVRCPICEKQVEVASIAELPSFPFCSPRCKLVDLGRWIDGDYSIARGKQTEESEEEGAVAPTDDDEE